MKNNKILISLLLAYSSISNAAYIMHYPINDIIIINKATWIKALPHVSDWVNDGVSYGCTNWSPAISTVNNGTPFNQIATDCNQNQTRSIQEREQSDVSYEYRNVGIPLIENRTIIASSNREAIGAKSVGKVCVYGATWGQGLWYKTATDITVSWWGENEAAGEKFSDVIPVKSTSYIKNNYIYTKGNNKIGQGDKLWSEVCREPI
jgi:hypothetical protein